MLILAGRHHLRIPEESLRINLNSIQIYCIEYVLKKMVNNYRNGL